MSTVAPLSIDLMLPFRVSTCQNTNPTACINSIKHSQNDLLPTSFTASQRLDSHDKYPDDDSHNLLDRLHKQKSRLIRIYELEIQQQQSTTHLIKFLDQIDQLLNEYENNKFNTVIKDDTNYDDQSLDCDNCSTSQNANLHLSSVDSTHANNSLIEQTTKVTDEELADCEHNFLTDYDDHSYAKISQSNRRPRKKLTILQLKRYKYEGCCPLTTRTYGLDSVKHGVRHFPCTRVTAPINLYKHLIQYHQLTHSPTMRIVRLLADENEEGDVDLFSSQSTSLIATHPTIYRAQCPLNQYGKFGITAEHKIRLCTQPNQPIGAPIVTPKDVCLYDHFVVYHQMKRSCAQRLAEAIVKNKTEPVFRSDEQLLNDTFYIQCPLRQPKTICWKSPISSRHMGQHLTGIHKLDRAARRQIMMAIRKQPSSSKRSNSETE